MKLHRDPECRNCRLHKTTDTVCILGTGYNKADVMIVGEAPGASEEAGGRPFIGRSGKLLRRILEDNGFDDENVFITNAVSCRPPDNRTPTKKEIVACKDWLEYQIERVKPKFVLLLGNTPCQSLLNLKGIKKLRGKPIEKDGVIYLPTYHPAFALRDDRNRPALEGDIALLRILVDGGGMPEEEDLNMVEVLDRTTFRKMLRDLKGAVSMDLETSCLYPWRYGVGGKGKPSDKYDKPVVTAIGFGTRKAQYTIPIHHYDMNPFTNKQIQRMVDRITKKLEDCIVIAQNGKFDSLWMKVHYGVDWKIDFDTMLAHYLLDENQRHDLKYLAQVYLGAHDYDLDPTRANWKDTAKYHCLDLLYTRKLRFIFGKKLNKEGNIKDVFDHILMPASSWFTQSEYNGVYINQDKMDDAEEYLRQELAEAKKALDEWGPKINWRSPKQIANLLFDEDQLGLDIVTTTKSGAASTAESVLNQIDHPVTDALLRFRGAAQQLSFFIEGWKPFLVDGYLHPSFKLHGAVTGRPSCEHPNLQQVPRDPRIRSLITAPPGWVLMEADLSQVEMRVAAELSGDTTLLNMFYNGQDVHWSTAIRELERVGGGDYLKDLYETTELFILSCGLPADGTSAKVLLDVWAADKKGAFTSELLQLLGEKWNNKKPRCREWWKSDGETKSLLERWRPDLGEEVPEELLRALQEYGKFMSSPQRSRSSKQRKIQFGDAVQVMSLAGPSAASKLSKTWKHLRKKAKAVNFGFLFGMWWKKFKQYARDNYGVTVTDDEAKQSRIAYFELYPGLVDWHKKQKDFARRHGYVTTLSGRKRRLPDANGPMERYETKEAQRQAINSPVQGFASDMNLMAAIQLGKEFTLEEVKGVGTIHDAILFMCREDLVEKVYTRVLEIMSHPDIMDDLDIRIRVPIEAEAEIGPWSKGVSLKEWLEAA